MSGPYNSLSEKQHDENNASLKSIDRSLKEISIFLRALAEAHAAKELKFKVM